MCDIQSVLWPSSSSKVSVKYTWTRTSSWATLRQPGPKPSSICGRCALASSSPLESTWSSLPPLSRTRMETSASECSPRSRQTPSKTLTLGILVGLWVSAVLLFSCFSWGSSCLLSFQWSFWYLCSVCICGWTGELFREEQQFWNMAEYF